jgi:hypothetical protein
MNDITPVYFRVSPALWRNRTWTDDMRLLACYLLTSPHRTIEGLFILPKGYIMGDLQWSPERLEEPFARLLADDFIAYDDATEVLLIRKALKYQRPENPNMDTSAVRRLVTVPATPLDAVFFESAQRFAERFAQRLAELMPERFGKPQLYSSSTQLSSNRAPARAANASPVDNSIPPDEEHRRSSTKNRKSKSPPTCDGAPCRVRELRCDIRRDVALIVGEVEAATLYGGHSDLSRTFGRYAGRICELCQAQFAEVERPEREEKCQAVLRGAVGCILTAHRSKPIENLPAYLNGELKRLTHIGDVCGDTLVRELRDRRHSGSSEPTRLGNVLPKVPALEQPQAAAKHRNTGDSSAA